MLPVPLLRFEKATLQFRGVPVAGSGRDVVTKTIEPLVAYPPPAATSPALHQTVTEPEPPPTAEGLVAERTTAAAVRTGPVAPRAPVAPGAPVAPTGPAGPAGPSAP